MTFEKFNGGDRKRVQIVTVLEMKVQWRLFIFSISIIFMWFNNNIFFGWKRNSTLYMVKCWENKKKVVFC